MGKTARIKGDLDDVQALLEIITILKDVSTNRFFSFAQQKEDLGKFLEVFLVFFNMLEAVETTCPLVRNNNPATDIVVMSSESGFMAQLNSKVCSAAFAEMKKNENSRIVCVGRKAVDKCRSLGMPIDKLYEGVDQRGRYETALDIRDYLIDRMMSGVTGKVICVYVWPKNFNILKPRVVKLLPASELIGTDEAEQGGAAGEEKTQQTRATPKGVLQESSVDGIMKVLADVWVSSRIFEILSDLKLAEAAAQSQQLESAIEGLSKEKAGLALGFKKAVRGDLNKAMREVFTSSKIIKTKAK